MLQFAATRLARNDYYEHGKYLYSFPDDEVKRQVAIYSDLIVKAAERCDLSYGTLLWIIDENASLLYAVGVTDAVDYYMRLYFVTWLVENELHAPCQNIIESGTAEMIRIYRN